MKAPDKIYMTPSYGEPDNVLLASFSKSHLDYHRDIEYIRADALLEWAKEQASITEKLNGKGAMLKAWNTLIEKLNSM